MSLKDEKPILRFDEQIIKLESLGITIGNTEEERNEIKSILSNNNYYFKILAYRKNYDKNEDGKYNVSFLSIADLAKLDMQLRYALLPYCLDIEHSLKTYLMRLITNRKQDSEYTEDGYEIVQSVFSDGDNPSDLKEQIFHGVRYIKHGEIVYQDGFEKYYNEPPIWVVLDLASIGKLKYFVKYLLNKQPNNANLKKIDNNISYVSTIRNACAHNQPILFNLQKRSYIKKEVFANAKRMGFRHSEISNLKIAQIFAVFELHRNLCSEGMREHRNKDFSAYLDRVKKTIELHKQNNGIKIFFETLEKILDEFKIE